MGQSFCHQVLPAAIDAAHLGEDAPLAAFVDAGGVALTIETLNNAFPQHFQHAFAAKANMMRGALALVREQGMCCEVASPGELEQALRAGYEPQEIVFDEPAKTRAVLQRVLDLGVGLNIDNFQEFDRVRARMDEAGSESRIGFRINPQVGMGDIAAMSTATRFSKFGVAIKDEGNRQKLLDCYLSHPWLTTLHTHVGSQGCSLELMAAGVREIVDLAELVNDTLGTRQVELIDIGGGLPVNFESDEVKPTFSAYAEVLGKRVPELFTGKYQVKTEFGRSIFAKNGFIASRVEYTKSSGGRRIATTHAGAQVATRTVFMPETWKLRLSVFDAYGNEKSGELVEQDIAGPLCFAGDLLATERPLPLAEPGDYVVLHDTGAYYFSNPFFYNALPSPAVYGVDTGGGKVVDFSVWRRQQTLDDMLAVIG